MSNCIVCNTPLKFSNKPALHSGRLNDGTEVCMQCLGVLIKKNPVLNIRIIDKDKALELFNDTENNEIYYSGIYVTGHPKVNVNNVNSRVSFKGDMLHILGTNNVDDIIIPLNSIIDVIVEDASTFEKRLTATRLLTLGIFAFAAKKKQTTVLFFLTIKWKDGKFEQNTIFKFEPHLAKNLLNPLQTANSLKSTIMDKANAVPD